jgi:LPS-assembly protein
LIVVHLVFAPTPGCAQNAASTVKSDTPPRDEIWYSGITQESDGTLKYLHRDAYVKTSDMKISADEIEFDSDTDWVHAHGHVHMEHFATGDKLNADHGEYNIRTDEGKFYIVSGTSPAKILTSPFVLTTTNPFYFEANSADRYKDRYILHKGFLTDCKLPKPWWIMQAPLFDVVPGNRAIARNAVLRVKHLPVFYLPFFYRPLGRNPRQSGFLTPTFGHSSFYGWIYGAGYYWAINRSYDMTGIVEDFSERGPAFTYQFRGRPTQTTDFSFLFYDVEDQGLAQPSGPPIKEGGREFDLTGSTQIFGFQGRGDLHYLSSFLFRQAFSYSFATLISNEVHSAGFLQRRFDDGQYTLNIVARRDQNYIAATALGEPQNETIVQKLPSVETSGRDGELLGGPLPVWFSFNASAGLFTREEPTGTQNPYGPPEAIFHTGETGRFDIEPHVYTAIRFKGLSLEPGITLGATDYTNSYSSNATTYTPVSFCGGYAACPPVSTTTLALADSNLFRHDADFTLNLRLPTLERIYTPSPKLHLGSKLKHVIEAEAEYEYVTGIDEYHKIIRFDETDILSNSNQVTYSLTNRLYKKDKLGNVSEVLVWRLTQQRYFDPTFGGAAVDGQRTIVASAEELTPYAFITGPRSTSPLVSTVSLLPYAFFGLDWRQEYDPVQHKIVVNAYSASFRRRKIFGLVGETSVRTNPVLFPQSNQINFGGGYGSYNAKGWNIGANEVYDLLLHRNVFQYIQGTYNTDCCGFSVQYRRINFGIRDENQYLFSFSLANLGTFGSLQRQDRIF